MSRLYLLDSDFNAKKTPELLGTHLILDVACHVAVSSVRRNGILNPSSGNTANGAVIGIE